MVGLVSSRFEKNARKLIIRRTLSKRPFYINLTVVEKAGSQSTFCREPQSVACMTEMVREGTDESYLARGMAQFETLGRAVALGFLNGYEFTKRPEPLFDHSRRYMMQRFSMLEFPYGHVLYESDMEGVLKSELCQVKNFIVVDTFKDNNIINKESTGI